MPLGALQHYTIEPSNLEATKDFYCDVLGLENGDRQPREGIVVRGTKKKFKDTGRFDHIAFAATDIDGVRDRLKARNVKFREQIVPRTGAAQIFLYDPDGIGVELTFPAP
jgi:catechol 2,3-dioxygenase-like lactoylglutathione lyase family enzyme